MHFCYRKTSLICGALLACYASSTVYASDINVGIVNCHTTGFKKILPTLERRLGHKIHVFTGTTDQVYQQLNRQRLDLIINHDPDQMNKAVKTGKILANSVKVIDQVEPVLWCPSKNIRYSVSALQTFSQPNVTRLANTTAPHLPMTHVLHQLGPLPSSLSIVSVAHPYEAMQAVQQGRADCAIVSQRMVANDNYQPLSQSSLISMLAIPSQSRHLALSEKLAYELSRPVMRAKLELNGFNAPYSLTNAVTPVERYASTQKIALRNEP